MSNGKVMIVHLIAGLIKKIWCENHSVEVLQLKLIFQIMQQKQILRIFHMLILRVLH